MYNQAHYKFTVACEEKKVFIVHVEYKQIATIQPRSQGPFSSRKRERTLGMRLASLLKTYYQSTFPFRSVAFKYV